MELAWRALAQVIPIEIRDGLPYVALSVTNDGENVLLKNALLDTGSHRTLLATDSVASIRLAPEPSDKMQEVFGIGGSETVVEKQVERLTLAEGFVDNFKIELGSMDYGVDLDAIVGLDLLRSLGAIIDLQAMQLHVVRNESLGE